MGPMGRRQPRPKRASIPGHQLHCHKFGAISVGFDLPNLRRLWISRCDRPQCNWLKPAGFAVRLCIHLNSTSRNRWSPLACPVVARNLSLAETLCFGWEAKRCLLVRGTQLDQATLLHSRRARGSARLERRFLSRLRSIILAPGGWRRFRRHAQGRRHQPSCAGDCHKG